MSHQLTHNFVGLRTLIERPHSTIYINAVIERKGTWRRQKDILLDLVQVKFNVF